MQPITKSSAQITREAERLGSREKADQYCRDNGWDAVRELWLSYPCSYDLDREARDIYGSALKSLGCRMQAWLRLRDNDDSGAWYALAGGMPSFERLPNDDTAPSKVAG